VKPTIQESYEAWRAQNPHVVALMERFAADAAESGRRIGVKALAERVRWELNVTINRAGDPFRFNNNFTSRIARELIARHPDLERTIEVRRLRAA